MSSPMNPPCRLLHFKCRLAGVWFQSLPRCKGQHVPVPQIEPVRRAVKTLTRARFCADHFHGTDYERRTAFMTKYFPKPNRLKPKKIDSSTMVRRKIL